MKELQSYKLSFISAWGKLKKLDLLAFLLIISMVAFYLRYLNFPFVSGDYVYYLGPWYEDIKAAGGLSGIGVMPEGCNYTTAYLLLMAFMTHLPIDAVTAIKIFSVFFDYILSFFVGLIVLHVTKKKTTALMSYTATLFLPAVFINSALWGQCDSIFVSFLVISLYYILKERGSLAMIAFGLAFSFKLQAIFFLPIVIIALLKGKIKFWTPILAVGMFILSGLPAVLSGMEPSVAYGAYLLQAKTYSSLNMSAPNLYVWVNKLNTHVAYDKFADSLVWFAFGGVGCAMLPIYKSKFRIDNDMIWLLGSLLFAALMPFLLPHMHERYWYFSDILALILLFCRPNYWYISLSLIISSLYSQCIYMFGLGKDDLDFFALIMLLGICLVGYFLWKELSGQSYENTDNDIECVSSNPNRRKNK